MLLFHKFPEHRKQTIWKMRYMKLIPRWIK